MAITKTTAKQPWDSVSQGNFIIPTNYSEENISLDVNIHHVGGLIISESHRVEIDGNFHALYDHEIIEPIPVGKASQLRGKTVRIVSTITKSTYPNYEIKDKELTTDFKLEAENIFSCIVPSNKIEKSSVDGKFPKSVLEVFITDYIIK